jgi:uncharacterized RDD family membrane protein YckC
VTVEAAPDPESTRVSGRRFVAHLLDGVAFTILLVLVILLFALLPSGTLTDVLFAAALVLGLTVGHVAYFVLQERRNGRTFGKRVVGIRVVDGRGAVPGDGALIKRTVPLLIEYFYIFALIAMMTSDHRQRWGDRWAGTYVIDEPMEARLSQPGIAE